MVEEISEMSDYTYSDEEKAFLAKCEQDFANRYTASDYDYSLHVMIGMSLPPCVEPWYPKEEGRGAVDNHRNNYQRNHNSSPAYHSNKRKRWNLLLTLQDTSVKFKCSLDSFLMLTTSGYKVSTVKIIL